MSKSECEKKVLGSNSGAYLVRKKTSSQYAVVINDNSVTISIIVKYSSGLYKYAKKKYVWSHWPVAYASSPHRTCLHATLRAV